MFTAIFVQIYTLHVEI